MGTISSLGRWLARLIAAYVSICSTVCNAQDAGSFVDVSSRANFGLAAVSAPVVTVTVDAVDPLGNTLKFDWRVTDGVILARSGKTISWRLPRGPGLHFAYVLVSNGKGGYTERRVAVSTDSFGAPVLSQPPTIFTAPPAPTRTGNPFASILRNGYYTSPTPNGGDNSNGTYAVNAEAYLDNGAGFVTAVVKTDRRGYFNFQNVPDGSYSLFCRIDHNDAFANCKSPIPINKQAVLDPYGGGNSGRTADYNGRVVLNDGNPCGTVNEFFGKKAGATATLVDGTNTVLYGPKIVSELGHYSLPIITGGVSINVTCESAASIAVPASGVAASNRTVFTTAARPVINSMIATQSGIKRGSMLPPPTGLPSDQVAGEDFFLSFKGIDSRLSACRYYFAIGAVKSCTGSGLFTGAITFDDWKRKTHMAPYVKAGFRETTATYVNKVDLNLTRNHHGISYGPNETAGYVCNHLGPNNATQAEANRVIDNAVHARNLVACVAMDYMISPGVNGNKPYVRFLIFGPDGNLLPSINLDGRREKFVPGVCVACHGGDHYAGRFPEAVFGTAGAGSADIGAHFLPFDVGNFVFSTAPGLTRAAQREAIYSLNQIALKAGPNIATKELVAGWYKTSHTFDTSYMPGSWKTQSAAAQLFYKHVYSSRCRTCHVAFTEALNFDHYANMTTSSEPVGEDGMLRTDLSVCGGSSSFLRSHSMPNSLQTMNLFWGSRGSAFDEPQITANFIAAGNTPIPCVLNKTPQP
jgi:hypothetical protein